MALKIVVFPWLAFGHLLPFFELTKSLAKKGNHIFFVSTPRNISRLPKVPQNLAHLINFNELQLPPTENLPQEAEATSDLPLNMVPYLKKAFDGLASPMNNLLQSLAPDWIICDFAPHWLPPIAATLDVPCAFFSIFNAASISFFGPPSGLISGGSRTKPEDFTVTPKWMPSTSGLVFRTFEALRFFQEAIDGNVSGVSDGFRLGSMVLACDVVFVRSCTRIEPECLSLLQEKIYRKPVLPVGLLPPQLDSIEDVEDENWVKIKEWLDQQKRESVVYVAFGSEATLNQLEMTEIALGLELSELPFFWVLRKPPGSTESILLPDGFEDRVKGRGIVWRGWVPQLSILSHLSVYGSLTHSGWSSTIETLGFGFPLVLLPMVNEQALLARMLGRKNMGKEIPRNDEDGWFTREVVAKTLQMVMVDEEGEEYRSKARELKTVIGDQVQQDLYIDGVVQYLNAHCRAKSGPEISLPDHA
ncbi:hypothetical protein ACHQM5_023648 [Ranunculus cassubicifolius]